MFSSCSKVRKASSESYLMF